MLNKLFTFRNILLLLLIGMISTAAILFYNKQQAEMQQASAKSTKKPALTVSTVQPKVAHWPVNVKLQGEVFPWQEAMVSSEISGLRIAKVYADVGQSVKRGQPLVRLADETIMAMLHKQEATVAREQALLSEAAANAERARNIKDTGALSSQKINEYLIAEKTAKANLALAQAELKNQQIQLKQTLIKSPDHGVITARDAKLGNVVTAGSPLFTLIRQNRIEWRAEVPTKAINALKQGQTVYIQQNDRNAITGKVRLISPVINTASRNGLVYVDIPNKSSKPGMYLTGYVTTGEQQANTLPQSAITLRDGSAYVFQITPSQSNQSEGVVKQIKIKLGRSQADEIEVLSNIDAQAQFVKTGGAFLNDGDAVSIVDDAKVSP